MTDLHAPQHVGSEQLQQMQKQHRLKAEAEPSKVKKKSKLASTQTLREQKVHCKGEPEVMWKRLCVVVAENEKSTCTQRVRRYLCRFGLETKSRHAFELAAFDSLTYYVYRLS